MKEKLRITIVDVNETIIQHDFNAYNFFDKPFLDLTKKYKLELKDNTSMVSKHLKKEIIRLVPDEELKYVLLLLLKQKHRFNPVNYQKLFTTLEENDIGSFKEVYNWFDIYKRHIPYCKEIKFERLQVSEPNE